MFTKRRTKKPRIVFISNTGAIKVVFNKCCVTKASFDSDVLHLRVPSGGIN